MSSQNGSLEEFFRAANASPWSEVLWETVLGYFNKRGVSQVIYHHLPPLGAADEGRVRVIAQGVPDGWLQTYVRGKLFRIDPVSTNAMRSEEPFYWSKIGEKVKLNAEQADLVQKTYTSVFGEGLAMQVFGPGGRNGFFGLSVPDDQLAPTIIREYQCVCQTSHQMYCRMLRDRLPPPPKLSDRELEVLEWVARGKSNSVIADIVGISRHTVDAYMRRVFLKLGTTDRITAAIRGLGTGLIKGYVA